MDCRTCKEQRQTVPYIVHEADMARQERTIKRLWILLIIVIFLLVGSNIAWLMYESSFEEVAATTTEIDAQQENTEGNNYAVGGDVIGETTRSH